MSQVATANQELQRGHGARAEVFPKALRSRAYQAAHSHDVAWTADDVDAAIDVLAAAGNAITGIRLWMDDGNSDNPEYIFRMGDDAVYHDAQFGREEGEPWKAFASRSTQWARMEALEAFKTAKRLPATHRGLVNLTWVAEADLSLFDLPAHVWKAIEGDGVEGIAPWAEIGTNSLWVGIGIRKRARPLRGSFYDGNCVPDLVQLPRAARAFKIDNETKNLELLREFRDVECLGVFSVDDAVLRTAAALPKLSMLHVGGHKGRGLETLGRPKRLQHLNITSCAQLTSLKALASIASLRTLSMQHVSRLTKLDDVGRVTQLRGFGLSGLASQFSGIPVESFKPLSKLRELRALGLSGVKPRDRSLKPLLGLRKLSTLWVAATFRMEEFAALSVAHPDVEPGYNSMWWNEPSTDTMQVGFTCKKCKQFNKGRTIGSPAKYFCPDCDAAKVANFKAAWDAARSAASRGTTPTRGRAKRA